MLDSTQLEQYERDGFYILRNAIPETDIQRLERGVANNPPLDATLDPHVPEFPAPGRYTLATQSLKDPDLSFIVEHPSIVEPVRQLLNDDPKLTAYVIYDRTPGGKGLPAHHDYKRWRPVGSSMNWLFTIIPFCDFDADSGRLFVAPGSHHLERQSSGPVCTEMAAAIRPDASEFIDPELKRGDLLFMNMHLWHRADANQSSRHRVGLFNKYAAASAPPATGYYLYDEDVYRSLSERGRELLAVHSDRQLTTTRAVLVRPKEDYIEVFLQSSQQDSKLMGLPGGPTWDERAIPDWDRGNMIAPLQQHLREQVRIETPWLSYIGDFEEDQGLCRVYGYTLNDHGFPVAYDGSWVRVDTLQSKDLVNGWEIEAVNKWLDPDVIRGKGLSQAQSRIDQFAY